MNLEVDIKKSLLTKDGTCATSKRAWPLKGCNESLFTFEQFEALCKLCNSGERPSQCDREYCNPNHTTAGDVSKSEEDEDDEKDEKDEEYGEDSEHPHEEYEKDEEDKKDEE